MLAENQVPTGLQPQNGTEQLDILSTALPRPVSPQVPPSASQNNPEGHWSPTLLSDWQHVSSLMQIPSQSTLPEGQAARQWSQG